MALIKCPECNREISDKSKVCIHCGYPLDDKNINCLINGVSYDLSFLLDDTIPILVKGKQLHLLTKCDIKDCLDKAKIVAANKEIPKTMSLKQQRISDKNIPKCPTCNSTNIEKISLTKKAVGGAIFGLFSSDVRKTMHCKNCGAKW